MPRFRAIVFDLLTALLDSWTLWGDVAGDADLGARWRRTSLELIYASGAYRPYEEIVAEAARAAGVDDRRAGELLVRWDELEPWPEAPAVLADLARDHRLALVTNTSADLAGRAAARIGVEVEVMVSAEAVGFYKPRPEPYRAALDALAAHERAGLDALAADNHAALDALAAGDRAPALFVAGSAGDVPGAGAVGLPVVWHNRVGAPAAGGEPLAVIATLDPLPGLVR